MMQMIANEANGSLEDFEEAAFKQLQGTKVLKRPAAAPAQHKAGAGVPRAKAKPKAANPTQRQAGEQKQ